MKTKMKALVAIGTLIAAKQLGEIKGAYIMLRKIDKDGFESAEVQNLVKKAKHIEETWRELKKTVKNWPKTTEKTEAEAPAEEQEEEETVIDVTETTAEEAVDQPED